MTTFDKKRADRLTAEPAIAVGGTIRWHQRKFLRQEKHAWTNDNLYAVPFTCDPRIEGPELERRIKLALYESSKLGKDDSVADIIRETPAGGIVITRSTYRNIDDGDDYFDQN